MDMWQNIFETYSVTVCMCTYVPSLFSSECVCFFFLLTAIKHATTMAVITSNNPITIPIANGRVLDALELSSGASCGTTEGVAVGVGVSVGARPVYDVVGIYVSVTVH
jgi:hypothetical protein